LRLLGLGAVGAVIGGRESHGFPSGGRDLVKKTDKLLSRHSGRSNPISCLSRGFLMLGGSRWQKEKHGTLRRRFPAG